MHAQAAPTYENRRFSRVTLSRNITFMCGSKESYDGEVLDLSVCGIRFRTDAPIAEGSTCLIAFIFDDEKEIEIRIRVISSEHGVVAGDIIGIRRDTFETLREILVSHTDEPGLIDNEIVSRDRFLPESY